MCISSLQEGVVAIVQLVLDNGELEENYSQAANCDTDCSHQTFTVPNFIRLFSINHSNISHLITIYEANKLCKRVKANDLYKWIFDAKSTPRLDFVAENRGGNRSSIRKSDWVQNWGLPSNKSILQYFLGRTVIHHLAKNC